ncbi:MAG: 30S ribosomal protein S8 [Candidatus Margulisbacteria bacterium]|nr:30S ribosomal protein S8 [Candidatus Margulisiibacteriota bacterium]
MDSIADMLVRINNAVKIKKETVDLPHSKMKEALSRIMVGEGFVGKSEVMTRMNKKYLRLTLKYNDKKKSVIEGLKRVSTPGRRYYVGATKIPRVRSGFGTAIISTPRGLMTDVEARSNKVGGEVICYIW